MQLQDLSQLFDSLDPSPSGEKDLHRTAEAYIVDSLKEFHSAASCELVIHLAQAAAIPDEESGVGGAIRAHFARRSRLLRRDLRRLLRRGIVYLGIGLAFLVTFFGISQGLGQLIGDGPLAMLLREGFLIVGWVAMWRPLEIFLYDWWPIVGERRIRERLSRITVRIVRGDSGSAPLTHTDSV